MKAIYKGCEVEAHREKSLGGWSEVYWSAITQKEGYEINSGFGGGTVREMFSCMKQEVDDFIEQFGGDTEKHSDSKSLQFSS
jgi:hypothetical protein